MTHIMTAMETKPKRRRYRIKLSPERMDELKKMLKAEELSVPEIAQEFGIGITKTYEYKRLFEAQSGA